MKIDFPFKKIDLSINRTEILYFNPVLTLKNFKKNNARTLKKIMQLLK